MLYSKPLQVEEIKTDGDEWGVSGYVSTFGNKDYGGDVVRPGAFKKTLKSGPKVRFLLAHDPAQVLGVPKRLREDDKGLFGQFKISRTHLGEETRQLLLDGAIDSFSFAYDADQYTIDEKEGIRYLDEVTLYEASLVAMPMNPAAVVTGVKTLAERSADLNKQLSALLSDLRGLVDGIDKPLSETKRQELTELLAQCAGLDAVRSDLSSVLSAAPSPKLVSSKLAGYQLAEARKRLARILQE